MRIRSLASASIDGDGDGEEPGVLMCYNPINKDTLVKRLGFPCNMFLVISATHFIHMWKGF